ADEHRRAVGEDPVALDHLELTGGERALVELHARDPPVVVGDRVQARVQQRFVVLVRLLQMLRGHEEPLGPYRLARVDHVARTVLPEVPRCAPRKARPPRWPPTSPPPARAPATRPSSGG